MHKFIHFIFETGPTLPFFSSFVPKKSSVASEIVSKLNKCDTVLLFDIIYVRGDVILGCASSLRTKNLKDQVGQKLLTL